MTETAAARDTRERVRWSLQSALDQCDKFCRDNNQRLEHFTDAYLADCRGKAVSVVREINRAMSGGSTDAEAELDDDEDPPGEQLRDNSCCSEAAAEPSTTTRPAGPAGHGASHEEGTGEAAAAGQQQAPDHELMEVVQLLEEERKAQDKQMENLRKRCRRLSKASMAFNATGRRQARRIQALSAQRESAVRGLQDLLTVLRGSPVLVLP